MRIVIVICEWSCQGSAVPPGLTSASARVHALVTIVTLYLVESLVFAQLIIVQCVCASAVVVRFY